MFSYQCDGTPVRHQDSEVCSNSNLVQVADIHSSSVDQGHPVGGNMHMDVDYVDINSTSVVNNHNQTDNSNVPKGSINTLVETSYAQTEMNSEIVQTKDQSSVQIRDKSINPDGEDEDMVDEQKMKEIKDEVYRMVKGGIINVKEVTDKLRQKQLKAGRQTVKKLIYKNLVKCVLIENVFINTDKIGHQCGFQNNYKDNDTDLDQDLQENDNGDLINLPVVKGVYFVHQSDSQRRILRRYGNVVFLDTAYKTIGYILPLYFLYVRTNCGYMMVATFICRDEDADSIAECLKQIREWNRCWIPDYVMTSPSSVEQQAVKKCFPCEYMCLFQ